MSNRRFQLQLCAAHPGVEKSKPVHLQIVSRKSACRRPVAQTPQHDGAQSGNLSAERRNGSANIGNRRIEGKRLTLAVSHAAIVKPETRNAFRCKRSGQQDKLPVAADAILRSPNDYDDAYGRSALRSREDADQVASFAFKV
jgi:hypothetical protein